MIQPKLNSTGQWSDSYRAINILNNSSHYYCSESGSFRDTHPTGDPEVMMIELTKPVSFSKFELRQALQKFSPQDWALEGQLTNGRWVLLYAVEGFIFQSNDPTSVFDVIESSGKHAYYA